jgi:hypothetical protein
MKPVHLIAGIGVAAIVGLGLYYMYMQKNPPWETSTERGLQLPEAPATPAGGPAKAGSKPAAPAAKPAAAPAAVPGAVVPAAPGAVVPAAKPVEPAAAPQ